jgi:hypothetical protein
LRRDGVRQSVAAVRKSERLLELDVTRAIDPDHAGEPRAACQIADSGLKSVHR